MVKVLISPELGCTCASVQLILTQLYTKFGECKPLDKYTYKETMSMAII